MESRIIGIYLGIVSAHTASELDGTGSRLQSPGQTHPVSLSALERASPAGAAPERKESLNARFRRATRIRGRRP